MPIDLPNLIAKAQMDPGWWSGLGVGAPMVGGGVFPGTPAAQEFDWMEAGPPGTGLVAGAGMPLANLMASLMSSMKVVGYHGATQPFDIQDIRTPAYFTNKKDVAKQFAESRAKNAGENSPVPRVEKVNIEFSNPFIIDANGEFAGNMQFGKKGEMFRKALGNSMYDGVIIKNTKDEGDVYIVTKPGIIK